MLGKRDFVDMAKDSPRESIFLRLMDDGLWIGLSSLGAGQIPTDMNVIFTISSSVSS
jgi:hypothetical protein